MPAIILHSMSFHYDSQLTPIFEDLSIAIDTSWKTGIRGANGSGKTTLLNLIRKRIEPTRGKVIFSGETFYFPYDPKDMGQKTLQVIKESVAPFLRWEREMEELLSTGDEKSLAQYGEILTEYEKMDGYKIDNKIEKEFAQMGMEPDLLQRNFNSLSGGEQTRALIISLFLKEGAFPLIDEPTNHLDMEGRALLGEYLARKEGFILVSHDRFFLDLCVDHILSLNKRDVRIHQGNYSQWKENMEREEQFERRQNEKLKREIQALERAARKRRVWADRKEREKIGGGDKGFIGHRAAKLMRRALSIEQRKDRGIEEKKRLLKNIEKERRLKMYTSSKSPEVILFMDGVTIEIENRPIVKDFSLTLTRGERIVLIGRNGSGKTTLLRAISGEIKIAKGSIYIPKYLTVARSYQEPLWNAGYLRYHIREEGIAETEFRNMMALFGVSGEIFERPLETFSEGERKKVDLCRSFLGTPHLFLWDEPLNYLDVVTREQIERLILEFQPTMLFVEHDRHSIERIATDVVQLEPPKVYVS